MRKFRRDKERAKRKEEYKCSEGKALKQRRCFKAGEWIATG